MAAEQRILCVGTDSSLTRPASLSPENGRFYRYPSPGTIHTWGGDATCFEESLLPGHVPVPATPGGPAIQGYGLIVLGDTYGKHFRPRVDSEEAVGAITRENAFEVKIHKSLERARGIVEDWDIYGALIIAGEMPTEKELEKARSQRRNYALTRLNTVIDERKSGRRSNYSPVEKAWAEEYGILLPETVASMPRIKPEAVEDTQCPECAMYISGQAKRCRFCQAQFGMPVLDFLTQPTPEAKRGPGRPKKEEVLA